MERWSRFPAAMAALLVLAAAAAASGDERPRPMPPEKLVYLLQYIGADYGYAVRDGRIASILEYEEMVKLAGVLVEHSRDLLSHGASPAIDAELAALLDRILSQAPSEQVKRTARGLVHRLLDELDVVSAPETAPDLENGRRVFAANCAPCHGPTGGADGFADPEMDPPPTSFRELRINGISPHQVYGATFFGIEDTAMPSFGEAVAPREIWDVAFFVMTLREDFAPAPDPALARPSLEVMARLSNEELLSRIRKLRPETTLAEIDHHRLHP